MVPVGRKWARTVTKEMLLGVTQWVEAFPNTTIENQSKKIIG
jgi:hypothetical protein